ncbi:unnamed protein product [Rotaria socialis]
MICIETLLYCKTSPPKLTNGLIKRDRVSYYKGQGYIGSMEYACLPNFHLIGNKIVTCKNGTWSKMAQCLRTVKHCSPIDNYPSNTIIESNNPTLFQNDPQQIVVGSTITLRCMDNYEFDSNSKGSLTIQCQNDGTWTAMPSCKYVQVACDYSKLYLPHRSRITQMNFKFSEHSRQFHVVGSNLEYTCEEGHRLHDGKTSMIVECLNTGLWSPLPVCEFVYQIKQSTRCNYPIYIKNGFLTLYNVTIWEDQKYTGRIVYECNYGYETLHGTDQIVSDCINGTWTHVNDCFGECNEKKFSAGNTHRIVRFFSEISTCPKQDLLDIESQVQNSYVHNVSLQYIRDPLAFVYNSYVLRICLPNFEHDPSSPPLKIKCQRHENTWTGIPICRAIKTTTQMITSIHEEYPTNNDPEEDYTISSTVNQFQTTIDNENYTTVPDVTHTIVCNSHEIPLIPNLILIEPELNVTYSIGTKLFLMCQSGDESSFDKSSFITCSMDGTWSTDAINISKCQSPMETIEQDFFAFSTMPSHTTEENNTTVNLDEQLPAMNITNESSFISTVANRQIRHTMSYCKEIPKIEHAQLLSDDTLKHNANHEITYSGSILFVCQHGFASDVGGNEPFRLTCQNGAFHPKIICIEKPRCSLPPPVDPIRSSTIDSLINVFDTSINEAIPGSFIVLNCLDKTTGENSVFNMTCLDDGQWSSPPSLCITPFKRRCQSGITIPNARTQIFAKLTTEGYYDDGSRVTYRCLENFVHDRQSGPLHIQCRNGRWGPRPICIHSGCLEPMPDTIEQGWKSAESYIIHGDVKYYQLTRYSCHENTMIANTTSHVIDIQCQHSEWEYESLPMCQRQE